jgi:hypothetical protein
MYAGTNFKDALRSIIWAWNMSAEPPKPMGSLLYEYFTHVDLTNLSQDLKIQLNSKLNLLANCDI